ncbi:MAG: hypothetical protein A3G41_07465 [Elusimicrobia bacterium RIFCSPLOWO2_12_FULL_59_9]|nr:MAG: hypothetical protein A3G41_07465 [Elusimicrobia bacterium RIFCSPLOWO2_12_FULL_59_9]
MKKFIQISVGFLSVVGIVAVLVHLFQVTPPKGMAIPPGPEWFSEQLPRYKEHPILEHVHILLGGFFILAALVQFQPSVRARYIRIHRILGRLVVIAALLMGASGFMLGMLIPFGGFPERIVVAAGAGLFLYSLLRAFYHVRRKQIPQHREWMMRCFSIGLGVAGNRVLDGLLYPLQLVPDRDLFWITLLLAWVICLSATEVWIRKTRPQFRPGF